LSSEAGVVVGAFVFSLKWIVLVACGEVLVVVLVVVSILDVEIVEKSVIALLSVSSAEN
jgi:hypothetical protein